MLHWLIVLIILASSCQEMSDCGDHYICSQGECVHKQLFPLDSLEIFGTCLVALMSALAGATGIGGGVLYVMFFVTLFGYNASESVALSQFTIMGASLMAVLIKMFQKHPAKNRPLISYDIIIVIISPLLIGTNLGVIANISLPYWLILLLLTGLLTYLSVSAFKSSLKLYEKESLKMNHGLVQKLEPAIFSVELQNVHEKESFKASTGLLERQEREASSLELLKFYEKETKTIPWDSMLIILSVFGLMVIASTMRGSRSFPSFIGIEFCSAWFWVFYLVILLGFAAVSEICVRLMLRKHEKREKIGYDFDVFDIKWDEKNSTMIRLCGLAAGLIGALVGVGGATIVNPVLLRIGTRPEVMTATGSFIALFASSISTLQYLLAGKISLAYGLWSISFAFTGSAIGVFGIKAIVEYYKRSSIISFTLASVMAVSAVIITLYSIINSITKPSDFGFHNYCNP